MSSDEREDHKSDKRRWHPLSLTPSAILIQEECIKFTLLLLNCGGGKQGILRRRAKSQSGYILSVSADLKLFRASLGSTKTQLNLLLLSVVDEGKMSRSRVKGHQANKFSKTRLKFH
jgi:hypothetical protein